MKTLILVRHAKSSWASPELSDFDRPLNARGEKSAAMMSDRLNELENLPQMIVCSTAKRAMQTADILRNNKHLERADLRLEDRIYEAGTTPLLQLATGFDDAHSSVMMIGHNPGFTHLLNNLQTRFIDNMPTCSIAEVALHIDHWADAARTTGALVLYDYPKKATDLLD